jgi:hypothetical protein
MTVALDPVSAHVAELDRVLRGPGAVKGSMIAEVRDGLQDAAMAYRAGGLDPAQAAAAAVRDFGEMREIAALLQDELTARQGRRTAQLLVVTFPAMLLTWDLLWKAGAGWSTPPPAAVAVLARAVDVTTVLITAAALVLLLVTFRSRPLAGSVTGLTGLVAALGVLGTGGLSVVMNLLHPHHSGATLAAHPAVAVVIVATTATAALVTRSAIRSLRVARASRRSDQGPDPQVG